MTHRPIEISHVFKSDLSPFDKRFLRGVGVVILEDMLGDDAREYMAKVERLREHQA